MVTTTWEEVTAQVKDRLEITDVVSQSVILKKKGQNYWGCCPFHNEKTPSFSVNPAKGIYKCFGCGEGGDVLSFLMKTRNQSFAEVIREQAEILGIELPAAYEKFHDTKPLKLQILMATQMASEFFTKNLLDQKSPGSKKAMEYLTARGITEEIIREYKLGYAPNDYEELRKALKKEAEEEILEKAGLIIKRERQEGYVDRFRHRIIIPIIDENGKVVAFGARALDEGQNPKYLNSPDTPVYNKSNILYGIYHAKDAIKEEDSTIIMEGYFDVISAQAHGIKNCVAACGTSLTASHIKLISRYSQSRRIYLAFDSDLAGRNAAERGANVIKEELGGLGEIRQFDEIGGSITTDDKYSCEIRVVVPPEGKDPDEFIQQNGAETYREYLKQAPLLIDFQIDEILKERTPSMTDIDKNKLIKNVMPYLAEIKNAITRNTQIMKISSLLDIDSDILQKELGKIVTNTIVRPARLSEKIVKKSSNLSEKAEKNLLSLFMLYVGEINYSNLVEKLKEIEFSNDKLIIVNSTIDKIFFQVNNVKELLQSLYTTFAENEEIKDIITELNDLSESFKNLSAKAYDEVICENIKTIKDCKIHAIHSELNTNCKNANDDDEKARMFQLQLREQLMNKTKTGDN